MNPSETETQWTKKKKKKKEMKSIGKLKSKKEKNWWILDLQSVKDTCFPTSSSHQ